MSEQPDPYSLAYSKAYPSQQRDFTPCRHIICHTRQIWLVLSLSLIIQNRAEKPFILWCYLSCLLYF